MSLPTNPSLFQLSNDSKYRIRNSLRMRGSSVASGLTRTPSASNRKTWTYSVWFKRGSLSAGAYMYLFNGGAAGGTDTSHTTLHFGTADELRFTGQATVWRLSTMKFRDTSAWYHLVVAFDTTQATAADRAKFWVNGTQITTWTTNNALGLNTDYGVNSNAIHGIGCAAAGSGSYYFDGLMAEINFIDGLALDPSYFAYTDPVTEQWFPKKYTGSYGTNGFYLPFNDATSTTTIGYDRQLGLTDSSKNNWSATNISVTAGTTYDVMRDSPTPYDDGVTGRGNYCTLNTNDKSINTNAPIPVDGNLKYATASLVTTWPGVKGTIGSYSGKFYYECDVSSIGVNSTGVIGWAEYDMLTVGDTSAYFSKVYGTYIRNDSVSLGLSKLIAGASTSYGAGADATNGLYQVAIDLTAGKIWLGQDGTWYASGNPGAGTNEAGTFTGKTLIPFFSAHYGTTNGNMTLQVNFGQRPFTYTPPSGYKALNTFNLPKPTLPIY